uniref:Salivary lipocalin n=1 Tax=Triatoma infestans TaxID=30076 RepID=A6YPN3_TRIIF|nr:salivary lipocalin [Triatoma infestans]
METITAMTFFGILTFAYATYNCSEEIAMSDFDPKKFFNEKWYLAHDGDTSSTVCQKFSTNETEGEALIVESGYKKFESKGITGKFQCDGGKKNKEQYSFKCKSDECGSESNNFDVDFTIVSAGDEDFAVICRSVTFSDGEKDDDYIVLDRNIDEKASCTNGC